jgi:hypothetical protein
MPVTATIQSTLGVKATFGSTYLSAQDKEVTVDGLKETISLNSGSTPAVTKHAIFKQALTAGAATIDLTSLTDVAGASFSGNGLKVRAAKFRAPATNANPITITPGASNGIDLFGASSSVTLSPGQSVLFYFKDGAPAIASGDKTLDLAGTGTQELEVELLIG